MILQNGSAEAFKGHYHATFGLIAFGACMYNVAAFFSRDEIEWHLALNAILYGVLTDYERRQWAHHREKVDRCAP